MMKGLVSTNLFTTLKSERIMLIWTKYLRGKCKSKIHLEKMGGKVLCYMIYKHNFMRVNPKDL